MSDAKPEQRKRGFSAVPFFGDLVVWSRLLRDKDAKFHFKLLSLMVLAYVISPIDAFPEAFAPLVAWIDDVGLVLSLRLLLQERLAPYRYPLFEAPPAKNPSAEAPPSDSAMPPNRGQAHAPPPRNS